MPHDPVSRRQFLHNIAAGSTGAALGSALAAPHAAFGSTSGGGPEPPWPRTIESYPIAEPGKGMTVDHLKIVTTEEVPNPLRGAYSRRILRNRAQSRPFGNSVSW